MISTRNWDRGARLARRVCDHVIMTGAVLGVAVGVSRAVIGVRVTGCLRMIMHILGPGWWFREWIADVLRNRLAGTVISAVPHPAG